MNQVTVFLHGIADQILDEFLRTDPHWSAIIRANARFGQRVNRANRHKWRRCYLLERQMGIPK